MLGWLRGFGRFFKYCVMPNPIEVIKDGIYPRYSPEVIRGMGRVDVSMTDEYGEHPLIRHFYKQHSANQIGKAMGVDVVAARVNERGTLCAGTGNVPGEQALKFVTETLQRWTEREDPLQDTPFNTFHYRNKRTGLEGVDLWVGTPVKMNMHNIYITIKQTAV